MTEHELHQLAVRESITLRKQYQKGRGYWHAYVRYRSQVSSVYLCAESRLIRFTETDFLAKIGKLPGRDQKEHLDIQALPGASLQISKGNRAMVLSYEDVFEIAQWIGQQKGVGV
jgi:hypothetical protein